MKKVISLLMVLICISLSGCVPSNNLLKNNLGNSSFKNDTGEYGLIMLRYGMTAEEAVKALGQDINSKSDLDIDDTIEDSAGKSHSFKSLQRGTVEYYEKTGTITIQCVDDALYGVAINFSAKDNDLSGYYDKVKKIISDKYGKAQEITEKEPRMVDGFDSGYSSEYCEWSSGATKMKLLAIYENEEISSVSIDFCDINRGIGQ